MGRLARRFVPAESAGGGERVARDALQGGRLRIGEAELVSALFLGAELGRVDPGDRAEGDERREIGARDDRVIMVVGPEVDLAKIGRASCRERVWKYV